MAVAAADLQRIALERRAKVEEFQQKHRVGLLTLLFTDVVDSTKLKQTVGEREGVAAIERHHAAIREVLGEFNEGEEIETAGDSFFIVFTKPSDAVKFSLLVQARLRELAAEAGRLVLDRIGIHVGEVWIRENDGSGKARDLYGIQVDTCARVQSLGEADQILLTRLPFDAARQALRGEELKDIGALSWLNHGPYVLKGVEEPLEICEVGQLGRAKLIQPVNTEKAYRFISPDSEPVLGWRPAVEQPVPGTGWVLEKKLGEGGFGEVWLGRDKRLKTQHVFKFCFRADRVRSLKREVTLFRLLKERIGEHPNIVGIEHVYFDEAPFYIVMQHVEGQDLSTWCVSQGGVDKVPLTARIEIVAQVAGALQAAHDSGVIHRDVKPSNILVGGQSDIHAYLTDFGIGQVVSEEVLSRLTHSGFTQTMVESSSRSGTQLYMAPELFSGKPASIRSDIYALGVVLYQLLIGDFSRAVTTDWAKQIGDPLLQEDLEKCFAGDPQERFAGAGQLAEQLRSLEERRAASDKQQALLKERERAAYRRGILRTAALALVVIGLVSALAIYAFLQRHEAQEKTQEASAQRQAAIAARVDAEKQKQGAVTANANLEAKNRELGSLLEEAARSDWLVAEEKLRQGEVGEALSYLARASRYTPKSLFPAQTAITAVLASPIAHSQVIFQGHTAAVYQAVFSPDGRRVLTASADKSARLWEAENGKLLGIFQGHTDKIYRAVFSPDGRRVLTASSDNTARLWEADGGKLLATFQGHTGRVQSAVFSPDGRRVLTGSGDNTARLWEAESGELLTTFKATPARSIARSSARTACGCSPPRETVPHASGRPGAANSWPLSKATPARSTARSLARTVSGWSRPRRTRVHGCGRSRTASFWLFCKDIPPRFPVRSLVRTAAGCSPPHGMRLRGSGTRIVVGHWPFSKGAMAWSIAQSSARTACGCSPPQRTRPRGCGMLRTASSSSLSKAATVSLARSLAQTGGGYSPRRQTRARGSGRPRAANSWPLSKVTPAGF